MKPKLLLTNDDGIFAEGMKNLYLALKEIADITIVAPLSEQSGVGVGISLRKPLQIQEIEWQNGIKAFAVNGTPADCVKMALSVLLQDTPDLIVSGINRGSNAGRNLLYSGTVGGVIEGVLRDIPGIALSCVDFFKPNFDLARNSAALFVDYILKNPLKRGTLLNVNIPSQNIAFKGIRFARQGMGYWVENPSKRVHPDGYSYYWLGGKHPYHQEVEDSDVALLDMGYITAVPAFVNELTHYEEFNLRKDQFNYQFSDFNSNNFV
jgi:5'-nucleotidase